MGHRRLDCVLNEAAESVYPYRYIAAEMAGENENAGYLGDFTTNSIVGDVLGKIRDELGTRWVPIPTLPDGTPIEKGMAVKGGVVDHFEVDCAVGEWGNWRLYSERDGCFAEGTLNQHPEPATPQEAVMADIRMELASHPDSVPRGAVLRWLKMLEETA